MPGRSSEGREWAWLDAGYVGHVQRHPGQWGWERSCQTLKDICCLTLAFILQQQNTIADVEIAAFSHQICFPDWQLEQNGRQEDQFLGRRSGQAREAVVMEEGQPGGCSERRKGGAWVLMESATEPEGVGVRVIQASGW